MIELIRPTVGLVQPRRTSAADFPAGAVLHGYGLPADHDEFLSATTDPGVVRFFEDAERGVGLPDGWVPCTTYWIVDGTAPDVVLGSIALRHHIGTDFLREHGGHIGFGVRPSARGTGVASAALRAALPRARALSLDRVLLTCDEDNEASRRTIESCGGVFERMADTRRRYWIAT
ncbi:GNAT family N-acetyltransferase [Allobranchiibius sp. CTAmp26]|uniref:GNAT family N-acetyltransferase n=1 Tax=Allobranchiibius sp. CTAmp26 TaxID=2815214 RepID=UPI001AA0B613|nr:GNAT family N-acetyltransferase [Allobranchiibius sp. CTAmp26]MBO1754210.1 GNAT family N-acetyltransferase [Allobranchiibius sp. CTAmp26]